MKKAFTLFETLGASDGSNNNTGIGLATIKAIIKRLGGKIYLQQRPDHKKGVSFCFYIAKRK